MLPRNALRAVVAALAVLVIAVLAYYFLLKPSIEAIARQELIAAGATIDPSGQPVLPGSQRQGGGGPTPPAGGPTTPPAGGATTPPAGGATTPPGAPSTPPGSGPTGSPGDSGSPGAPTPSPTLPSSVAAQRDGRLLAGSEELVPAGVTLYITDLIFSNPSDTVTGRIIVGRRDHNTAPVTEQTLLELQLQNFRDLDYHWVTPLSFGSNFAMFVSCPDPDGCAGAAVSWSGYQR